MKKDGSDLQQITRLSGFSGMPVWSPSGDRLAFQWRPRKPGAKWQLMIAMVSDGGTTEITDGSANDQVVNWSPDGESLVFHSDRTGRNQLYVWEDGTVRRVAETPFSDKSATWSPDGKRFAFVSERSGQKGIYLMNVDGTNQRRVGNIEIEHGLPFFSPDGSRLLITPTGLTGVEIWTLDIDSGFALQIQATCSAVVEDGTR